VTSPLCLMVHVLIILSKLSQAIKHDIAEVKDDIRKGQKGEGNIPLFVIISDADSTP